MPSAPLTRDEWRAIKERAGAMQLHTDVPALVATLERYRETLEELVRATFSSNHENQRAAIRAQRAFAKAQALLLDAAAGKE